MALRGAIRPQAGSFPSSGRSEGAGDMVLMDLEKSGKAHPLGEGEAQRSVISEYRSNDVSNFMLSKTPTVIADIA